jgi:hypothetical protein
MTLLLLSPQWPAGIRAVVPSTRPSSRQGRSRTVTTAPNCGQMANEQIGTLMAGAVLHARSSCIFSPRCSRSSFRGAPIRTASSWPVSQPHSLHGHRLTVTAIVLIKGLALIVSLARCLRFIELVGRPWLSCPPPSTGQPSGYPLAGSSNCMLVFGLNRMLVLTLVVPAINRMVPSSQWNEDDKAI